MKIPMKAVLIAVLFALNAVSAAGSAESEHPMAKIISMLKELQVKAREEGEAEAVLYQKFQYWCKNTKKELSGAIKAEKAKIEILEDEIESKTKLKETLEKEIAQLEKELEESEAAGAKADKIRDDMKAAYDEAESDFTDTISAIEECITALEDTKGDVDSLLAQKSVRKVLALAETLLSDGERGVITAFLQGPPKKPDAKVYTFKSGSVIELLKKLKEKFETDLLDATKAETNSVNAYNLAKDAREQAEKAARKAKEEKETILGEAESAIAEISTDLEETKSDLADNENNLAETTSECDLKADEWKTRSATRENEIAALDMAIKILAKVGGVRAPEGGEEAAPEFLQIDDPKTKAVKMLLAEAQKLHSKSLKRLAQEVSAHLSGPFDEINNMIQKMIFRLMAEQKDEDDHKNWCDMELEKSTESKEDKEGKKEELEKKIDVAEAKTVALAEEISVLTDEIAELEAHIKEATEIRNAEHEDNMITIKDAQDAQEAISNAIAVLKDFYKESGKIPKEPWEFVQMGRAPVETEAPPETWDSSYTGLDKEPDGIITLMETISEDFASMEAETKAQEDEDQKAYDEDMTTSAVNKAEKEKSSEMKTHERSRLLDKLKSWKEQLKHVVSELEAVVQYLKDLEPACVSGDSTYEDRKQARADEIEALRKAQTILESAFKAKEEGFLQQCKCPSALTWSNSDTSWTKRQEALMNLP